MNEKATQKDVTRPEGGTATVTAGRREGEVFLRPAVDIWEDGDSITLQMDMAGVSKDRLSLQVEGDQLLVEGQAHIDVPEKMEALHAEVRATRYRRSFAMSRDLETDKIDAALKDGVLTVRIPKREHIRTRRIPVHAA